MIESEVFGGELVATILAGEVVADINIFSAEPNSARGPWSYVSFQSEDARQLKTCPGGSGKHGVIFQDLHLVLEPQDQGLLPTHNSHRLIARIEKQRPC